VIILTNLRMLKARVLELGHTIVESERLGVVSAPAF
jgi:hypothetical protein